MQYKKVLLCFFSFIFFLLVFPHFSYATEFGTQIDSNYPDKIPNLQQLQQLNPAWIRTGDNTPIIFSPEWPSSIKLLIGVNGESARSAPAANTQDFNTWKTYIDTKYIPYIQNMLKQHPNIPAIEIWNEEDVCATGFCPYVPPNAYSYMLTQSTATIKSMNPGIKVIMGGLGSGQRQYLRDVMNSNPAGFQKIDAVGMHPYGGSPDGWCAAGCSGGQLPFGDLAQGVTEYKQISGKPVWVTEIGTNSSDKAWQAEYLTRSFTVLQRIQVPVAIWFSWSDIMVPGFGLMDGQKNMKPSGYAFRKFNPQPTPAIGTALLLSPTKPPPQVTFYCLGMGSSDSGSCLSPLPSKLTPAIVPSTIINKSVTGIGLDGTMFIGFGIVLVSFLLSLAFMSQRK